MKLLSKWILISCIGAGCTACCNNEAPKEPESHHWAAVQPPVEAWDIPFADYQVNPAKDTLILHPSGSSIHIPPSAFVDNDGNVVKSPVRIKYREFQNAFDIYAAGITMEYDSSGVSSVFETAGMLQIEAFLEDGEPVYVNPDNKISIDMVSLNADDGFNQYLLDTVSGNWSFENTNSPEIVNREKELAALPEVPVPPRMLSGWSFEIKDYKQLDRSLEDYDNVWFQPVDGERCGFNCTDYRITDLGDGTVEVVFIADVYGQHYEEKCICYLAFEEEEAYSQALKQYYRKYGELITQRKKDKELLEQQWSQYRLAVEQYNRKVRDFLWNEEMRNPDFTRRVVRSLNLNQFGFINIDKPSAYPQGGHLLATYSDREGNPIHLNEVILVEKGKNALFRYREGEIYFNPNQENVLWGITDDKRLAYFTTRDFQQLNKVSGEYTLNMHVASELKSYEDVLDILLTEES